MNVSKDVAQSIVEEMKKIINQDINYFNTNSIIIASTDKSRIGNYHGGAKNVLESNSDLVIRYDEEYEGAKKGINIPIYFQNEIVGVIGITGDKNEVEKYGRIIQRMTEILIKESYLSEQKNIARESKRQFIEDLLFRSDNDEKALITRGDLLNIKTNIPRVVIVSKILDGDDKKAVLPLRMNEKILNYYKSHIDNDIQNLIVQSGTNIIMILNTISKNNIDQIVNYINEDVNKIQNTNIFFGIGDVSNNSNEIKRSFREAKKALNVAVAFQDNQTLYYSDLDIGLLINDMPKETIKVYNEKILGSLSEIQISEYNEIIDTFVKYNGSITKTSEELFIHKNTLQYRLNKLRELTGYDPRVISDMVVLYLAFTLYKLQ